MTNIQEIWKDIPKASGYQISNKGNIRSIQRQIPPGRGTKPRISKGRTLKACKDKDGYLQISLGKYHPRGLSRKIHRLVMITFIGESNLEVNHKDGNKQNNALDNLEYVTHSQNHIHCRNTLGKLTGENHWNYKITPVQRQAIKSMAISSPFTRIQIANIFQISKSHLYNILKDEH